MVWAVNGVHIPDPTMALCAGPPAEAEGLGAVGWGATVMGVAGSGRLWAPVIALGTATLVPGNRKLVHCVVTCSSFSFNLVG